jgi:hypothetical protein
MDKEVDFQHLVRSLDCASDVFAKVRAGKVSSEALIASAEYELAQARKEFAANRLDTEEPAAAPKRRRGVPSFASKLRKAETLERPKWRAALGLG